MSFRFIHAADIHLDSPLRGLERYEGAPADEFRKATRRALENLIDLAIEREVQFVLIAGDLYDGDWKDHNTGLFFVKQVTRLRDAGIALYVISGNHDAASTMTKSLKLPTNPDGSSVMLSHDEAVSVTLDNIGAAIHGRGFDKPRVIDNVVTQYPAAVRGMFNIGVLHTSLDSEAEDLHARYAPCKLSDLQAREYDYWALGHIHQGKVHCEQPFVAFSGNIQGRHIRETGKKGCHVVKVNDQGKADVRFEPVDVCRWDHLQIDATTAEDEEALLAAFSKQLALCDAENDGLPFAVRVTVSGKTRAHEKLASQATHWINQLRAVAVDVSSGRAWVERVCIRTSPSVSAQEVIQADGPIGQLLAYFDELQGDDEKLVAVASVLDDLNRKLPDELKQGDDGIDWTKPENLRPLLEEVRPLLLGRLLDQESSR